MKSVLFLICCFLILAFGDEKGDLTQYKNDEGFTCKQDTPAMSTGDEFVSYKNNIMQLQENFEVFILGLSDAN